MTTFVIALLLFSATTGLFTVRAKPVCRMLTLEGKIPSSPPLGGGTKGAYQAGAFMAMANFMDAEEVKYDVITGSFVSFHPDRCLRGLA